MSLHFEVISGDFSFLDPSQGVLTSLNLPVPLGILFQGFYSQFFILAGVCFSEYTLLNFDVFMNMLD